uniref:Uncharacterized protein n=1 Tax=Marseillevirus LCMAC102 TaxID=2506603 RepID=A0A481YU12_9VIRU|nr:MAG: hypothetical protein LCMAC102_03250 [Marseillevirus LCMAC102]
MSNKRNLHFYTELVLVTVLSLIAANSWVRFLSQTLDYYFPRSLVVDLIVSIIMTIVAIYVLHLVFSARFADEKEDSSKQIAESRHKLYGCE